MDDEHETVGQIDPVRGTADLATRLKKFADLEVCRRELEKELDLVKRKIAALQGPLLEDMATSGLDSVKCGGLTIFRRIDRFVSKRAGVSSQDICDTLRDVGCDYMVADGYSASSLKSKVIEWLEDGIAIPETLLEKLNIGEVPRLVSRR